MKKKEKQWFSIVGAVALFSVITVLGCKNDTTDTTDNVVSTPAELAVQLAAKINAIETGAATANGTMVTVTDQIILNNQSLVVPAGVTLDLTNNNAGLMLRNSTLTVNGTVNTNLASGEWFDGVNSGQWEAPTIRLEDSAMFAIINGSGSIKQIGKGSIFVVDGFYNVQTRMITLEGVTLVGYQNNDQPLVVVRGQAGCTGTFLMKSGTIKDNKYNGGNGGGILVELGGTFRMEGGAIYGNSAQNGGGVYLKDSGTSFKFEGGRIQGSNDSGSYIKNIATSSNSAAVFIGTGVTAKWGWGENTLGSTSQAKDSNIISTNETMIAK